jgi:hypothetical protein
LGTSRKCIQYDKNTFKRIESRYSKREREREEMEEKEFE